VFYLEAEGTWYRFFIDSDVLFWVTTEPDPEDDLADDEDYIDILAIAGKSECLKIRRIEMSDGSLSLSFDQDFHIHVYHDPIDGTMKLAQIGPKGQIRKPCE